MIKPTVGRVVLYWPAGMVPNDPNQQPHAATIAYVWNDRMVNLSIVDQNGFHYGMTSVVLAQDDDQVFSGSAEWMPY